MEEACDEKCNWNGKKKTMREIIMISLHIFEDNCRNHIEIRKQRKSSKHDHLKRKFPKVALIRRQFIFVITINGISHAKMSYWGRHSSCNFSVRVSCATPSM